jgi:hypothetical protein
MPHKKVDYIIIIFFKEFFLLENSKTMFEHSIIADIESIENDDLFLSKII